MKKVEDLTIFWRIRSVILSGFPICERCVFLDFMYNISVGVTTATTSIQFAITARAGCDRTLKDVVIWFVTL